MLYWIRWNNVAQASSLKATDKQDACTTLGNIDKQDACTTLGLLMNKEKKIAVTLLILGISSYFLGYFFNAFISRCMTPELYGDFSIMFRSIAVISLFLLLGTNISSVKYLSIYFDSGTTDNINSFMRWNLKLIFKTFAICFILFILFYLVLVFLHVITVKNFYTYHYSVYALWLAPFSAFCMLLSSYLLGNKLNCLSFFFNKMAVYFFLIIFLLVFVFIFELSMQFYHILLFLLIIFLLIIIIELILLNKVFKEHNVNIKLKKYKFESENSRKWFTDSLRLTPVQMIYTLLCFIDLLIIEWIHPSEQATGYYAAMFTIVNILWVVPGSVTLFLAPRVTPLIERKNYKELQIIVNVANYINLPILILILFSIIYFSNFLLAFFGSGYASAQIPLIVLSIAYFFIGISLSSARVLIFLDSKAILFINALELIFIISISPVLTYYFGILGMSFAVLIATVFKVVMIYLACRKRLPIKPFSFI